MTTIRTHHAEAHVSIESTGTRATPPPAAARFREALSTSAGALLTGVESASSLVPGAGTVAAAVRGTSSAIGSTGNTGTGESPEAPGGGEAGGPGTMEDAMRTQADDNMRFLQLQAQIQAENQRFTTLSNVMKARHETAKTAIGNIR